MCARSKPENGRRISRWMRTHEFALRLGGCFLAVAFAAGFVATLESRQSLPFALDCERGSARLYLACSAMAMARLFGCGLAAQFAATSAVNGHWKLNFFLSTLNILEVTVSALLLRIRSTTLPQFTSKDYQLRFFLFAMVAGPVTAGLVFTPFAAFFFHGNVGACFLTGHWRRPGNRRGRPGVRGRFADPPARRKRRFHMIGSIRACSP